MRKKQEPFVCLSDGDLFLNALVGVTPIEQTNHIPIQPPVRRKPVHHAVQSQPVTLEDPTQLLENEIAPTTFLRIGLNRITLRKLRRGDWIVQDTMDLHGYTSNEAQRSLAEFIAFSLSNALQCVCVIHGKGSGADGREGILKIRVRYWLTQFPDVLAYCETPVNAGGGGAVWVLLKKSNKSQTI